MRMFHQKKCALKVMMMINKMSRIKRMMDLDLANEQNRSYQSKKYLNYQTGSTNTQVMEMLEQVTGDLERKYTENLQNAEDSPQSQETDQDPFDIVSNLRQINVMKVDALSKL
jgi:uncharacterized membrane protein YgaE (UPF0421/DUF939 family)